MRNKNKLVSFILVVFCAGCATGKSISNPEDIGDDGKHNTVVMTYDIKLYTANRYPSVKETLQDLVAIVLLLMSRSWGKRTWMGIQ